MTISAKIKGTMQEALPILSVAQFWTGIMARYILDYAMCDLSFYGNGEPVATNPAFSGMNRNDSLAISVRSQALDFPAYLAIDEGIVGLIAYMLPQYFTTNKYGWLASIVPGFIAVGAVCFRLSRWGILGCFADDSTCCTISYCPEYSQTASVPGCDGTELISWHNQNNYCPWPEWYNDYKQSCPEGLGGVPKMQWCYFQGCSYEATPTRFVFNVFWTANAFFVLFCIIEYSVRVVQPDQQTDKND